MELCLESCLLVNAYHRRCFAFSTGANVPEQILFSPYACDLSNPMELERRTMNLQQWVDLLEGDIVRERKAKDGIQHLAQVHANVM